MSDASGPAEHPRIDAQPFSSELWVETPQPAKGYPLTRQDFAILCEGEGVAGEQSFRDRMAASALTFLVALAGSMVTAPVRNARGEPNWHAIGVLLLFSAGAIVTSTLWLFFRHKVKSDSTRRTYRQLRETIEAYFERGIPFLQRPLDRTSSADGTSPLLPAVTPPEGVVLASGDGGEEFFIDTDGTQKNIVVLGRRAAWKPLVGAQYVWARPLPTDEEARKGCTAILVRRFRLGGSPRSAMLRLRVDDTADVSVNGSVVATGLVGYSTDDPHELHIEKALRAGQNEMRITVHNQTMDAPHIMARHNPSAVAYRIDLL